MNSPQYQTNAALLRDQLIVMLILIMAIAMRSAFTADDTAARGKPAVNGHSPMRSIDAEPHRPSGIDALSPWQGSNWHKIRKQHSLEGCDGAIRVETER